MIRLRLLAAVAALCGVLVLGAGEARGDPGRTEPDTLIVRKFRFAQASEAINALWNDVVATVPGNACTQYRSYLGLVDQGLFNAITPERDHRLVPRAGRDAGRHPGDRERLLRLGSIGRRSLLPLPDRYARADAE